MNKIILFLAVVFLGVFAACGQQRLTVVQRSPKTVCVMVKNHTTAQPFDKDISVKATIENVRGKGQTLDFKANKVITKVMVYPQQGIGLMKQTTFLEAKKRSGLIYLDAPSYKASKTYLVEYYSTEDANRPVWVSYIERKQQ